MNRKTKSRTFLAGLYSSLLLFILFEAYGQKISGIVYDGITQQPIPDAAIYIDKTTRGTISFSDGSFSLDAKTLPVNLVFSHINYELLVFNQANSNKNLHVYLKPKSQQIKEVSIYEKDERKRLLEYFKKTFLGDDYWGKHAEIMNDSVLFFLVDYFDEYKKKKSDKTIRKLEVFASGPLKIDLPKLGYSLSYDLEFFYETSSMEDQTVKTAVKGYSHYFEKKHEGGTPSLVITNNRLKAYYNSPMHFLRSLYKNQIAENGYKINYIDTSGISMPYIPDEHNTISYADNHLIMQNTKELVLNVYYYGYNKSPVNLVEKSEHLPYPIFSSVFFLKDTTKIKKDGTLEDFQIIFSPAMGTKMLGAILPSDFIPKNN